MGELVRFGVSMDAELLSAFDFLIEQRQYDNRSEAIRDLVRDALVKSRWEQGGAEVTGTLCLCYDHTTRDLAGKLTRLQHQHGGSVVSTLHVHLDRERCLEVSVLKGRASDLQKLADKMTAMRGVEQGQLVLHPGRDAPGSA